VTYSTVDLPAENGLICLLASTAMFLRPLSISLVLVGIAVASVNLHVQDSDFLSVKAQIPVLSTQTEVISAWVNFPFRTDPLYLNFEVPSCWTA